MAASRVKQRRSFPQHTMSNHTDGRTVKKEVCKEIETPYEQKGNRDYQQQPQRREQYQSRLRKSNRNVAVLQ